MNRTCGFAGALAVAAATLVARAASAVPIHASDGTFNLSWEGCTGPLDKTVGAGEAALFDHSFSVVGVTTPGTDCGGVEQPICFATIVATYLDANGTEINWGLDGNLSLTANGSVGCPYSAAQPTTWGAIKSQYRN